MFANCQLGGQDIGAPDVCLTPSASGVTPVTYTNTASGATGTPAAYTVLFGFGCAHNLSTTIPISNGDEAGVSLGTCSGTFMGPGRHTLGANTCLVGGMPASRMTSVSMQNSTNSVGTRTTPSQVKVLIMSA
ncbi:MAG: DUF4150 domain-containing protein [Myxococcota bacterium]